jgi:hypothetical protein
MSDQSGDAVMSLTRSETVLRLLVGLALGLGFLGFATRSHAAENSYLRLQDESELERIDAPEWVPEPLVEVAARVGIPHAGIGAAPPMVWRDGKGLISIIRPGVRFTKRATLLSIGGNF